MIRKLFSLILLFICFSCTSISSNRIKVGAERTEAYLPLLMGKRVGLVVNQSSLINKTHLVDTLLSLGVNVVSILAPEHGFRGAHDAGELVNNEIDTKTGLPIISLYGNNKKPKVSQFDNLDVVIFDIQDVGVRFYTYISTMHYVMETCAESNTACIVFDRPNPNGDYVAGPILKPAFKSFVGMHPIPIVHGLTVGELATMINGEGWLSKDTKCDLTVIGMNNYSHADKYELPIKPSPNLPNYLSIRLYPSLCLFEATNISIGRGTYFPFQVIGYPDSTLGTFSFTPVSIDGMAKKPKQMDKLCYGDDLRSYSPKHQFTLELFIQYYHLLKDDDNFTLYTRWFNLLMGDDHVIEQVLQGKSFSAIEASWLKELDDFKLLRKQYLLYNTF